MPRRSQDSRGYYNTIRVILYYRGLGNGGASKGLQRLNPKTKTLSPKSGGASELFLGWGGLQELENPGEKEAEVWAKGFWASRCIAPGCGLGRRALSFGASRGSGLGFCRSPELQDLGLWGP